MPVKHNIRYLPAAAEDLMAILEWISLDSPSRAVAFVDLLDSRIGHLADHPLLGRIPRDEQLRKAGYRVLIIGAYLAFHIIRERVVEIHRVIHGSRQLEDII
jgi:plasmid stabilization system protein ParE